MAPVTVTTGEGYQTIAQTRTHTWQADETTENGGKDSAPDPMELLMGALGSCIVITLHLYANRKGWPLEKVAVELDIHKFNAAEYAAYQGDAQFVHEIKEQVTLFGDQLTEDQRARLMDVSTKCPVRRVLSTPTFFVHPEQA